MEQQSFEALRAALTSAPILRVWNPGLPTRLTTDATELAVSGILEQPDPSDAFYQSPANQPPRSAHTHPICWNGWWWSTASSLSVRISLTVL